MTVTHIEHDTTTCGLCLRLATGETKTKNGVDISPLCERCGVHHFEGAVCSMAGLPPHTCPRCRSARLAVVHIMAAMRPDRTTYGAFCGPCYEAPGYVRNVYQMRDERETWELVTYEKPLRSDVRRTLARMGDPFEGLVD